MERDDDVVTARKQYVRPLLVKRDPLARISGDTQPLIRVVAKPSF